MSSRLTRVGIVGAGLVIEGVHLPILRAMQDVKVTWICDVDAQRARTMARLFNIPAHATGIDDCDDVDVALVAIPVGARRETVCQLLARGAHVFCEKPFAASVVDHEAMITQARRHERRLGVALMRRFFWSTTTARKLVCSGTLGPIRSVIAGEGNRLQRTGRDAGWYQASTAASGGGAMRETGSHIVDQAFSVIGAQSFALTRCAQRKFEGLEYDTHALGEVTCISGARSRFSVCVSRLRDTYNGVCVLTENAELRIGPDAESPIELRANSGEIVQKLMPPLRGAAAHLSSIRAEWAAFIQACSSNIGFSDDETALLTTAFIDACYSHAKSGATQTQAAS